jgi:hypothetical protein
MILDIFRSPATTFYNFAISVPYTSEIGVIGPFSEVSSQYMRHDDMD